MSDLQEIRVLLLSIEEDLPDWLMDDLGAVENEGTSTVDISGYRLLFEDCRSSDAVSEKLKRCNLVIGLARHMDVETLEQMASLTAPLESGHSTAMLAYREDAERDFKMSCPYCGQKLWVRDADIDKRGLCPNCKKGFTIPKQEDLLVAKLRLHGRVVVKKIFKGNPASISGPLNSLFSIMKMGNLDMPSARDAAGQSTRRIEIQGD